MPFFNSVVASFLSSCTEAGILQLYSTMSEIIDQNRESSQLFSLKPYNEFFSCTLGGIVLTWLGFCTSNGKEVYSLHGSYGKLLSYIILCTLFSRFIYSGRYFSLSFFILCASTAPKHPLLEAASTHKYFVASSLIKLQKRGSFNNRFLILLKAILCFSFMLN